MNKATITGPVAELRWGYAVIGSVSRWSMVCDSTGGDLTASVSGIDTFGVSQQPLTFLVPRPTGPPWVWPIDTLLITGETLRARLGLLME